jgi:hypothetical protein
VSASLAGGQVRWVRVVAEVGGTLSLRNPWAGRVEISRLGAEEVTAGEVLTLETLPGEVVLFRGVDR